MPFVSDPTTVGERIEPANFRTILGRFCSGVTVITATGTTGPVGFTCQSFYSVSLDPPLVSFSVANGSLCWPSIEHSGAFCVNILAARQEIISRTFAVSGADKFAKVDWSPSPVTGSPSLAGSLAWVDCTIDAVHSGGDHRIIVGRVEALATGDDDDPLLFYLAGYRRPAPARTSDVRTPHP